MIDIFNTEICGYVLYCTVVVAWTVYVYVAIHQSITIVKKSDCADAFMYVIPLYSNYSNLCVIIVSIV